MLNENDIEAEVRKLVKTNGKFAGYTVDTSIYAINPLDYKYDSSKGGVILISCSGLEHSGPLYRSFANMQWRVVISLGIADLRSNKTLWEQKGELLKTVAFQKLLPETGRLLPVSDSPIPPRQTDGVQWVQLQFTIKNITGIQQ